MAKQTKQPLNQAEKVQKMKKREARSMLLRCLTLLLVFASASVLLGMRLSVLQIDEAAEWKARASNQQLGSVTIQPLRGNIYDANMKLMAQSATVWTVEASPDQLNKGGVAKTSAERDPARVAARELARILELDEAELYEKLADEEKLYYKVKAKIEKPIADEIRQMCKDYGIYGIYLTEDTKRYYPYETLGSTVLGFVGADNNGLEGIERWYEDTLAGTAGRSLIVRDARQNEIAADGEGTTYPAEDGNSIVLTLNTEIQRSLETHLQAAVEKTGTRQRGFGIVMDVKTGAILGMAVYPSYNPNDPYTILDAATLEAIGLLPEGSEERAQAQGEARTLQWRNKVLADTYEPGSVMKIITAAAALDSGTYTQEDCFLCGGGVMVEGWEKAFTCANAQNHGSPTLRDALIKSCNVSFVRISAGLGKSTWYDYVKAFGLVEPTGIDLPGEPGQNAIDNLVYSEAGLGPVQLASCSFGQSNKYTAVQMITAVCAAVNGGNLMQPYIVQKELDPSGNVVKEYNPVVKRQVISPETSAQLCDILEELVAETSNGKNAYIAGYRVGGKSGTSEKLEVRTNEGREDAFISSFLGFAPADDPEVAVLLALDEPLANEAGNYFGGSLAGPYMREVLRESLGILGVEPEYTNDEELARSTVKTPNCGDKDLNAATKLLNEAQLTYRVVGAGDKVLGQTPAALSQMPYGGEVVLYTDPALPQETAEMPDLLGRSPKAARELLRSLGLNVLMQGAPDEGGGVVVVAQSADVGAVLPRGTMVTVTLEDKTKVVE